MKLVRSALIFVISGVLVSACFNPPEFSNTPEIEFEGVYFGLSPAGEDSLVISVSFRDGNGDLGLSATGDDESPYHEINFYANKNGELAPISSYLPQSLNGYILKVAKQTPDPTYALDLPPDGVAELITLQSRNEGFTLPPFVDPFKCASNDEAYLNDRDLPGTVLIFRDLGFLIKDKSTIKDTVVQIDEPSRYWFLVEDYFYIRPNVGHNNMYVKFFVEEGGTFVEYDFAENGCETNNGRFPILTDRSRAVEGIISYSMVNAGFLSTFGNKQMKLEVTIYDRALNASNTILTPAFRLEEI